MKRFLPVLVVMVLSYQGFSQQVDESTRRNFSAIFTVINDFYVNMPASVDDKFLNLGINFSGLYDYRLGKSNFSFAFGIGLGSHNLKTDALVIEDITNVSDFSPIEDTINFKKNKITYTYFDVPVEFRLRTKSDIRASVGFKFGFLIDSHSKYRGDDIYFGTTDNIHVKIKDVPNIEKLRYGLTARFGWKFINLTGFYSLTNLFTKNKGPETYPISVGISLMPF